ncbi:MAG: hypothetical protein QME41_02565 [Actinomycetota bacterium]|nr:hypothetical protein [Actinomycetota bacterium]
MRYRVLIITGTLVFMLLFGAVGSGLLSKNNAKTQSGLTPQADSQIVKLQASWAKGYLSIDELYQDADLVVEGMVVAKEPTRKIDDLLFTDKKVRISKVFKNTTAVKKNEIYVRQTGGRFDDVEYVIEDEVQYEPDKRYILFLRLADNGLFVALNGPQAQFLIQNDRAVHTQENWSQGYNELNLKLDKLKNK